MRHHWFVAGLAAAMLLGPIHTADAGMIGMPMQLKSVMQHISFDTPPPAPIADTQVCERETGGFVIETFSLDALRAAEEIRGRIAALNVNY